MKVLFLNSLIFYIGRSYGQGFIEEFEDASIDYLVYILLGRY